MPTAAKPYRLKHYHELKMSGQFDAGTVEELAGIAVGVTLGKYEPLRLPIVPVDNVHLYDVSHVDTGNRRPINRRGATVRVYESTMLKITRQPLKAPRFALQSVILDTKVGEPLPTRGVETAIHGRLLADLRDCDLRNGFSANDLEAMRDTLREQKYAPYIFGRLVIGQAFSFGKPHFHQPPNENYDDLIALGSFNDSRLES